MTPLEALQDALAAEHAAVFAYGVVGGRISVGSYPTTAARLRAGYDAHLARRDLLRSLVADRGADPVPAEPSYRVAAQDRSPANLTAVAREVELGCSETYALMVAGTSGDLRRLAISAMTDCSLRSLDLGAAPQVWPGAPDLR